MKVKRLFGISVLTVTIVLVLSIMIGVYAQPTESNSTPAYLPPIRNFTDHEDYNESTFGTFSYTQVVNKANMQGFYSNYTNMFHYFGDMGRDFITHAANQHDSLGYAYSPDGVNWNINPYFGMTEYNDLEDFATLSYLFDVVLEPNGRDFWLVSLNDFHTPPDEIIARKGYLLMNGSIRWYAGVQTIMAGTIPTAKVVTYPIDAEVDSNGRLFVAFLTTYSNIYIGYVRWTDQTDGTWIQAGQACYESLLSWNKPDDYREWFKLNRLLDGKMAWTGIFRDMNNLWWVQTHYFNGVSWIEYQQKGLMGSAAQEGTMYKKVDIVSYGGNLVASWTCRDTGFQRLKVAEATYNTAWTNVTQLITNYPEQTGTYVPHLTATWDGNIMLFVYKDGSNQLNYTYRFSNYTWVTPFIENILNVSDAVYYWNRFSFMDTTENIIPFWFQDGTVGWEWMDWSSLQFHYFSWNGSLLPLVFEYYNTTLYDEFGNSLNGEWMFEGDIYTFETYVFGASTFTLNFTDGQHDIQLAFDNSTGSMYISAGERFVIGEIYSNYTLYPDGTQKLLWRFVPDINIVDISNTTVNYEWYSDVYDFGGYGDVDISFHIYNLGGITYYTFIGDGGRTAYGSAFDLYATDGNISSSATAEQIFRKLQHVSFLMEINMGNEWDAGNGEFDIDAGVGYVDIGIDYRLNHTWVDGFKIRLYIFSADVGHHLGGNDQDWVLWSVDFYNYLPVAGTQQNLKTAYIYSNQWGYERRNFTPDRYDNRTACQLWIDLWFDKTNASTTIATQTNAYYRGMKEQGSAWWFGYGEFTPMIGDYDNAKFLDDLYDEGGNITNVQKFDLMKFYITVGKVNDTDGNDETWRISAVEDMHRELAIDRMEGIDEPTFVETKIIDMPQTGFINALKSAINGLSKLIWAGAFQFVKLLMGAVGSLMDAIGLGEWWRAFNTMLGRIATYSLNLLGEMEIALINSALLLTQIFNLVSAGIGKFVIFITAFVTALLSWYVFIVDIFSFGGVFNLDIWNSLNMGDFVLLAINLMPFYWVFRIIDADDSLDTAMNDIKFIAWMFSGMFKFLVTVIMLSVNLLNLLLGLLPI